MVFVVAVTGAAVVVGGSSPDGSPDSPSSSSDIGGYELTSRVEMGPAWNAQGASAQQPFDRPAVTPPDDPEGKDSHRKIVDDCLKSKGAQTKTGRTYNRFLWCQRFGVKFETPQGLPDLPEPPRGPARVSQAVDPDHSMAVSYFYYDAVAWGRDDGTRGVRVWLRSRGIGGGLGFLLWDLSVSVACKDRPPGEAKCAKVGGNQQKRTLAEWNQERGWHRWDMNSSKTTPRPATNDLITYHDWWLQFSLKEPRPPQSSIDPPSVEPTGGVENHGVRCDSATYFQKRNGRRNGACIFEDVIPHLRYRMRGDGVDEVAAHIKCAFDLECKDPRAFSTKGTSQIIAGQYHNRAQSDPLFRGRKRDGRATKEAACARLARRAPAGMQCDEFPFAITDKHPDPTRAYSVKYVNRSQNNKAGADLMGFFRDDRILYDIDPFYVEIVNNTGAAPAANLSDGDTADGGVGGLEPQPPATGVLGPHPPGDEGSRSGLQPQPPSPPHGVGVLEPNPGPPAPAVGHLEAGRGQGMLEPDQPQQLPPCRGTSSWTGVWGGGFDAHYPTTWAGTFDTRCTLGSGSTAAGVPLVQYAYNACYAPELGVPALRISGDYGPATKAAVQRIQAREGVPADGTYGPATQRAMKWPNRVKGTNSYRCLDNSNS